MKYVPIEKRSKKERRRLNAERRGTWYGINPVTRKPANSKAYDRAKARREAKADCALPLFQRHLHVLCKAAQ